MKRRWAVMASVLAATTGVTLAAHAAIVAVTGDIVVFLPADVSLDQTESDTDIVAFQERGCFQLPAALQTDQGVIPGGTYVKSHFLHGDPVTSATLQGRIRFDTPIIGVISTSAGLDASAICEHPAVTYPAFGAEPYRGLDAQTPLDQYVLLAPTDLAVRFDIPSYSDQIRVLNACDQD